ncbi:MAG: tetratricopeptide repeat protein [Reichenbachiella sp.]
MLFTVCLLADCFSFTVQAQNKSVADSLIIELSNPRLSDSIRCVIYNEICYYSVNPDQIEEYALMSTSLANKLSLLDQLASGTYYLGGAERLKGNYSEAIAFYIESAKQYQYIKMPRGVGSNYIEIANVYLDQKDYPNAKNYYQKSIAVFRQENDSVRLASALLNIGELYREVKVLDSALLAFKESGLIFEKVNYPIGTAYNLGNVGLVYAQQEKFDSAEYNMHQAIAMLEELGDRYPIAVYETSLADIYAKKGNMSKAMEYAHSALNIGLEEGLKEQVRDASMKLSELYNRTQDYHKAYEYQSQYLVYRDSINNEETTRKIADLRTEYEVGQKQTEVDLLQVEKENQQLILIAGTVVLVLVVAFLVFVYINLQNKKRLNKQLDMQRSDLADLNQLKDQFFSVVSHDLRGPMGNLVNVSDMMQTYLDNDEIEEVIEINALLRESSTEIVDLLENLLNWAMAQQDNVSYDIQSVSVEDLCNANLRVLQVTAKEKNIELLPLEVWSELVLKVDENTISTAVRNLISNALKFTHEGGKVEVLVRQEGAMGVISVKDNGIGIPEDKMDSLFSFTGDRKRWGTSGEKGIGLGLNLVKEFVYKNNGHVKVISEEGKGSEFEIHLPLT